MLDGFMDVKKLNKSTIASFRNVGCVASVVLFLTWSSAKVVKMTKAITDYSSSWNEGVFFFFYQP